MSFRAKPAVTRKHTSAVDADHRRNLMLTVGFGIVVLLALLILFGAAAASWYGDHLANLATVNGQGINKDDFRARAKVETFRLDYVEARIRQRMQEGKLSDTSGQAALTQIQTQRTNLETNVMDRLIDASLVTQLAGQQGLTVSDQQVSDQLTTDATTPESRHLWVIGIKPKLATGETTATDQEKADAKAKADQALADLKAGKPWEDAAKVLSDEVYSSQNGDAGWVSKGTNVIDKSLADPLFALPANGITDVILGEDGMYRIGRVTEIDAEKVDPAFQQKLKDAGISLDSYKLALKGDAYRQALDDKIVAGVADQVTTQRHVADIFINVDASAQQGTGDEVEARHILFAPNDDAQAAQSLPSTDPAWKKAEDEANAEYEALIKDPSKFAAEATAKSDDTGTSANGGLLPYYTKVNLDPAFGDAIFADGLTKDQILKPVKSSFGWHVIQYVDRRKQPSERMKDIVAEASAPGADFAALAAKYSEDSATKDKGGDQGWVSKYQLDSATEIAIFNAAVNGLTPPITTSDGIRLYKILDEQNRKPDTDQAAQLKANAFSNWYTAQKNAAHIERLYSTSDSSIPPVQ